MFYNKIKSSFNFQVSTAQLVKVEAAEYFLHSNEASKSPMKALGSLHKGLRGLIKRTKALYLKSSGTPSVHHIYRLNCMKLLRTRARAKVQRSALKTVSMANLWLLLRRTLESVTHTVHTPKGGLG